jgi:RNA polymerase sigma factor (sigma-70 family)
MANATLGEVLRYLRQTGTGLGGRQWTDGELVDLFLAERMEAAFALLVQRHGPMVLDVCQRVLGDRHAAEDAFQATFLVLVRQAASIRKKGSVASWLHVVARRLATKMRAQSAARNGHEKGSITRCSAVPLDDVTWQELRAVLDEEIGRLAEKYRAPIVLCYLEGKSYEQAASELGWPKSSLARRLARARDLLRGQLTQRGIAISASSLALWQSRKTGAAPLAARLTINLVKAATLVAAGKTVTAGSVSMCALVSAEEALQPVMAIRGRLVVVLLAIGLAVGGVRLASRGAPADRFKPEAAKGAQTPIAENGAQKEVTPVITDLHGDPLPQGAVARLGTVRFRHGFGTRMVGFAPGGKILASGDVDLCLGLCLCDAVTGQPRSRLAESYPVWSFAFSPDGSTVALVMNGTDVSLWDVTTGKELRRYTGPDVDFLTTIAISPDGQILAAGESMGQLRPSKIILWDIATAKEIRRLEGHQGSVPSIAFSPDGTSLASGSADKTIRLWDVGTGVLRTQINANEKGVYSVVFAPGGKTIASVAEDGWTRLWDTASSKQLHAIKSENAHIMAAVFSPDARLFATGEEAPDGSGTIRLWNPETGKLVRQWVTDMLGAVHGLAFSPDGKAIASISADCVTRLWDPVSGKELHPLVGHRFAVDFLRFALDGKSIFSQGREKKLLEWDIASGRPRRQVFSQPYGLQVEVGWVPHVLALSSDGKLLAVAGNIWKPEFKPDPIIRLWDTVQQKEMRALSGHEGKVEWLEGSPDGSRLASGAKDGIRVWNLETGKTLIHLKGLHPAYKFFAFSPAGGLLAALGADNTIRLHDVATGKEMRRWDGEHHSDGAWLTFSSDGKLLASNDVRLDVVRVWSVTSGKRIMKVDNIGWIEPLAFSPSSRILAIGARTRRVSPDDTCRIHFWETISGKEIRSMHSPQGAVWSLAFAPDGKTLASGGAESTILLWDMTGQQQHAGLAAVALTFGQMEKLWVDLAQDAATADQAIWAFARESHQCVPFLKERLRPAAQADSQQVARLIGDLDSPTFAVREKAAKALEEMGAAAEAALRRALAAKPTLEARRRLEPLLEKREKEVVRPLRAIEALEHVGTAESRQVLESLAKDSPNPRAAEAAAAALMRLAERRRLPVPGRAP